MDEIKDPKKPQFSKNQSKLIKIIISSTLIYIVITLFDVQFFTDEFKNYFKDNGDTIISLSVILISLIILFSIFNIKIPDDSKNRKLKKKVTIESFNNESYSSNDVINLDSDIIEKYDMLDYRNIDASFCNKKKSSSEINDNCKKLSKNNCNAVDCCILLDGNKCVGGDDSGPTFLNENGKDIDFEYYYFKDTCKGKCP